MNYLVTVKPKLGGIREELVQDILTLVQRGTGFELDKHRIQQQIRDAYLSAKRFEQIILVLTADQVVSLYSCLKRVEVISIIEQDPQVVIDLAPYSRYG